MYATVHGTLTVVYQLTQVLCVSKDFVAPGALPLVISFPPEGNRAKSVPCG